MTYGKPGWTADKDETLRQMLSSGHSRKEIGKVLGISRGAVSGRAHRLGLSNPGHNPQHDAVKKRDAEIAQLFDLGISLIEIASQFGLRRKRTIVASLIRSGRMVKRVSSRLQMEIDGKVNGGRIKQREWKEFPVEVQEHYGPLVALLDLDDKQCRYPIGHPGDDGFGFCAAPRRDELCPYCSHHARIAYATPKNISDTERERLRKLRIKRIVTGVWDVSFRFLTKKEFLDNTRGEVNGL